MMTIDLSFFSRLHIYFMTNFLCKKFFSFKILDTLVMTFHAWEHVFFWELLGFGLGLL